MQTNQTVSEKAVVRRISGAEPYVGLVEADHGDRASAVREDGFLAGFHGEEPTLSDAISRSVDYQKRVTLEPLEAEASRLEQTVERHGAALEESEELLATAKERTPEAAAPIEASLDVAPVRALYATLYMFAAGLFIAGEVALSRITIGPVFGLPTRGPGAWEGWVFAGCLALLVIPFKIATDELVIRAYREGLQPARRRYAAFMLIAGLLSVGSAAMAGYIRWIHILTEGQNSLVAANAMITPLFQAYPMATGVALILVTMVFTVSGGLCLSFGTHQINGLVRVIGRRMSEGRGAFTRSRDTKRAQRKKDQDQAAHTQAKTELVLAQGAVVAAELRMNALREYLVGLFMAGYTSGRTARQSLAEGVSYADEGRLATSAFVGGYGFLPTGTDATGSELEQAMANGGTPLYEQARTYLDQHVFN